MVVLDIAIVNVALPSIQVDLGVSEENLQWVISAYALAFGGFLLLGGRAADLLGRRRVFLAGLVVFATASLLAGRPLDPDDDVHRGPGAEHRARRLGRRRRLRRGRGRPARRDPHGRALVPWIFYVNVPVGIAAVLVTPFLLRESRDALGAVLVTAGLSAAVFGITQANSYGWGSGKTAGIFAAAIALLAGFVAWETRASDPLMRFSIFRLRTPAGGECRRLHPRLGALRDVPDAQGIFVSAKEHLSRPVAVLAPRAIPARIDARRPGRSLFVSVLATLMRPIPLRSS